MDKKKILTIICVIIIILGGIFIYKAYTIEHALKVVKLSKKEVEVYEDVKLSDLIKKINGKLIDNPKINTEKIGKKRINFEYITDEGIEVPYTIEVNVVDKTPPIISRASTLTVTEGYKENIEKEIFCGDNYDDNPKCYIEGKYDVNTPGNYNLTFIGVDSSNNKAMKRFVLTVTEKSKKEKESKVKSTDFKDIYKEYKTKKTKIGIDVSHWQGDIDFEKVKASGVEFAYIRVGRGDGIGEKYVLDSKFKQNIEGFNEVGIPVGVYFYSYANSTKDAVKEAKWVMRQIRKYDVDLEIAFDWENWSSFQEFDLSFHKLTELSNSFNKTVEKNGYKGMLYSSKSYLETIWENKDYPVWLAHYTKETDYQGKYKVWQISSTGKVSGIDDNLVDINIMYR